MTLPVIIIGAGGHGKVIAEALDVAGYAVLGFVDADQRKWGTWINGLSVLGGDGALKQHVPDAVLLANGIGSTGSVEARRDTFERFRAKGYRFVTVAHPRAIISLHARVGEGVQVMAGAIIQPSAEIGANSIINTGAVVEHDCRIGEHCHLGPGCVLSGGVAVGAETHIGTGATVIQGVSIGRNVLVAAGSVVVESVVDGASVMGVPAREQRG